MRLSRTFTKWFAMTGPDVEYVASVAGTTPAGSPILRVVTDGMQVLHVAVPRKQSGEVAMDQTVRHALAALRRRPKPVR